MRVVVVLAGVDQHALDPIGVLEELPVQRRRLEEVGPRPDDAEDRGPHDVPW